jgi:hypothetical protein
MSTARVCPQQGDATRNGVEKQGRLDGGPTNVLIVKDSEWVFGSTSSRTLFLRRYRSPLKFAIGGPPAGTDLFQNTLRNKGQ